jgi:hypothetical protein
MCTTASRWVCSQNDARIIGNLHEIGTHTSAHSTAMDYYNNGVGRTLAPKSPRACREACESAAQSHLLYWFVAGGHSPFPTDYSNFGLSATGTVVAGTVGTSRCIAPKFPVPNPWPGPGC